jgi:hypothetical protein
MTNLVEVISFIKKCDINELNAIKKAWEIQKSVAVNDIKSSLKICDVVSINHRKIASHRRFSVLKINGVNVKVKEINGGTTIFTVAPSLLVKI